MDKNIFTISIKERFLLNLKKDLSKDFNVDGIDMYKFYEGIELKKKLVLKFEVDITDCNSPQSIADKAFKFWDRLRNNFKLEVER